MATKSRGQSELQATASDQALVDDLISLQKAVDVFVNHTNKTTSGVTNSSAPRPTGQAIRAPVADGDTDDADGTNADLDATNTDDGSSNADAVAVDMANDLCRSYPNMSRPTQSI